MIEKETLKEKQNITMQIIRQLHSEFWDRLILTGENDMHGKQEAVYKPMRQFNNQEKDTLRCTTN